MSTHGERYDFVGFVHEYWETDRVGVKLLNFTVNMRIFRHLCSTVFSEYGNAPSLPPLWPPSIQLVMYSGLVKEQKDIAHDTASTYKYL